MGKNSTIGEDLIKPSISAFLKTVLERDDNAVKTMPLSNITVNRRLDEMSDAECGFSAVNDLLSKKRNRLDITKRGDLRFKPTNLEPDLKSLCR
ncbi:hypothetical protein TNCV_301601 [Trichonephila clavipes]|nr:hypothetical protein TNCV_301601 [Trichonephila clavipes]